MPRGPLTLGNLLSSRRTQSIVLPLAGLDGEPSRGRSGDRGPGWA